MRKFLVVLTVLMLMFSVVPAAMGGFTDAPKSSHWAYDNFILVYNSGLLKGYPDGTFKGERFATRYEMVELTGRVLNYLGSKIGARTGATVEGVETLDEEQVKAIIAEELINAELVTQGDLDYAVWDIYNQLVELETEFREELDDMGFRVSLLELNVERLKDEVAVLRDDVTELQGRSDSSVEALKTAKTARTLGIIGIILGIAGIVL